GRIHVRRCTRSSSRTCRLEPMGCRVCSAPECECVIVPADSLHLALPAWDTVTLRLDPSAATAPGIHPSAQDAARRAGEGGGEGPLRAILAERREGAGGRGAAAPICVVVHGDAATALREAARDPSDAWHVALPPRPRASLREWTLRGFAAGAGVVDVGMDGAYDVVSHNWPRTDRPRRCHAGVLGIWWELWEQMLPQ